MFFCSCVKSHPSTPCTVRLTGCTHVTQTSTRIQSNKRRQVRSNSLVDDEDSTAGHTDDGFPLPARLFSTQGFRDRLQEGEHPDDVTVYTLRLETGTGRRDGMDDLSSGIQLLLIGKADSLLHRIGQIKEYHTTEEVMSEICEIVGTDAGAACGPKARSTGTSDQPEEDIPKYIQRRFQSGSVDEVCFMGPDVGELHAVIVGPECGAWKLQEMTVSNSKAHSTQRFVCRDHLGYKSDEGAAVLTPVPDDKIVYGSGDQTILLSGSEAQALREEGMLAYDTLKRRILTFTAIIVASGVLVAGFTGGVDAAQAFMLGGILAVAYQLALNRSVDSMPLRPPVEADLSSSPQLMSAGGSTWDRKVTTGGVKRPALMALLIVAALYTTSVWDKSGGDNEEVHNLSIIITAMLGFASYKMAVVAAALTPAEATSRTRTPAQRR